MSELITFDGFSLRSQGPTLSLGLVRGQSMVLLGPAASGKTRLLKVLLGQERPSQGLVTSHGSMGFAGLTSVSRRTTPMQLAMRYAGARRGDVAAAALQALRLRDVSEVPIVDLSPSQRAACELVSVLAADSDLMIVDGQLDLLDPWTRRSAIDAILARVRKGFCAIVATHRPELIAEFDVVVVLQQGQVRFAGSLEELLRSAPSSSVTIESTTQEGVKALVDPFSVRVRKTAEGTVFWAEEGQQLAAKLLLEGYGNVRFVVLREPSAEDAVLSTIRLGLANDPSIP
jgi:ABC-type multidrug transport system ATPase subunit